MASHRPDAPAALLTAMIQVLLGADRLDDVRDAIAHGARMISPWDALTLREVGLSRALEVTLRRGEPLDSTAKAVERHLAQEAIGSGRTVSTLDRFSSEQTQGLAEAYVRRYGLCLARPLEAYGEPMGVIALHYAGRTALSDVEFDTLRRFADAAAAALFNARARQDLRDFAYTDPLTGLASRRRLDVELAKHKHSALSLLLIDFDGLKAVNDTLSYDRGDVLIQTVGAVLAANVNEGEVAARLGGDEFVVVLPGCDEPTARMRAEEVTQLLDGLTVPEDLESLFHGASVGNATATPGRGPARRAAAGESEMRSRKRRRKTDREVLRARAAALRRPANREGHRVAPRK